MNELLGGAGGLLPLAGPFLLSLPSSLSAVVEDGEVLGGLVRLIEEATGFGGGALAALGGGGTLLVVVVALAVIRRVASLVVLCTVFAGLFAWWAGWIS